MHGRQMISSEFGAAMPASMLPPLCATRGAGHLLRRLLLVTASRLPLTIELFRCVSSVQPRQWPASAGGSVHRFAHPGWVPFGGALARSVAAIAYIAVVHRRTTGV